jgi:hypothetical protein
MLRKKANLPAFKIKNSEEMNNEDSITTATARVFKKVRCGAA